MKKLVFITLTIMIGALSVAQTLTKEEKDVAAAVEALRLAMVEGTKSALEAVAAPELSYGHSGGHVENKAEFVEKISSGRSDFVTIELSNQTIKVAGNTAIVRHDLHATTNDAGKEPGEVNLHILLIFQKQKGKWLMIARQAVKLVHK